MSVKHLMSSCFLMNHCESVSQHPVYLLNVFIVTYKSSCMKRTDSEDRADILHWRSGVLSIW